MIPLSYFLIAWFIFLGIYGIMSLISMLQLVRLGLAGAGTFLSATFFMVVIVLVVLGTGSYFVGVDWHQGMNLFGWLSSSSVSQPLVP
ncbi:MAG: hypothetical protein WA001_00110 [Patescibacteria group bacterium]